ncbi:MAG: DUF5686 and carboxypeptidase regulatory-like domain-containing protein [Bacteroidota bacterium]
MRYIFTVLILLLASYVQAGVLKGKITDAAGTTLPYATVYVEGTTIGVSANGNGDYELSLAPGLYKVICQYIGYKQSPYNVSISGSETVAHNFVLKSESLEMKEVVIRASTEDPAYRIIRNAIKRRTFHLDQVHSFQTGIYLKGVMRSRSMPKKIMGQEIKPTDMGADSTGKGVLYLIEEDADYYSQGNKERTVIHSVHESGNKSGLGFSQFPPVITFYNNNVNVFGNSSRGFISPVSDNALTYYKYKLLGEFTEQGHTVYKIQVTQKRAYEPCFNGTIYIVDEDWAIHSLNMALAKQSGMDIIDTLKIDQLFLPLQKDTWVVKSQLMYFTINMLGFDVTASGVTVYNRQKVNETLPDTMFSDRLISVYDKSATKKDSTYWTARPVPLEADEKKDFVVKDSIAKVQDDPKYVDSMRRRGNKFKPLGLLTSSYTYTSKEKRNTYTINPLLISLGGDANILNYNVVEGVSVAPKVSWRHKVDTGSYLHGDVAVRYGFANTHFNAIGRLYYTTRDKEWLNRSWLYGAEGGKYVFQYNPDNPVLPWFNTFAALFARQHDLKIYERWDAAAFVRRNYGNGLQWFIKASYQQRLPLNNTTDYSILKGKNRVFASNTPPALLSQATAWEKHDAVLFHGSVSFKPGYKYVQYPDYKVATGSSWPRFTLQYDKGVPGILTSKTDFDKWKFSIQDNVRLRLFGTLMYNVAVGGFLNTRYVSFPDLMHLWGNRGIGYASPYLQSYQFAQYYEFSNKERIYGQAHIEHHLNGLLSNKVPLLRQARYYLLFGGNAFYANKNTYYTEAFVGIDNIGWKLVRILRVDFVQSWDSHNGRNSGIRFGLTIPSASQVRSNITHSEW